MKKQESRAKANCDPVIVSRVKNYLAENVDKTFVDVSQMARSLKERYREYNNRNDSAFCQAVESAYKVVLQSYGLDGASTSEASEEESDLEMLDEGGNSALNEKLLALYKHAKKRPSPPAPDKSEKSGEPIDIISSDDEVPAHMSKMPKINDQITITPTNVTTMSNMPVKSFPTCTETSNTSKSQHKSKSEKHKSKSESKSASGSKKKFEVTPVQSVKVSFDDVGGISEVLSQLCDLILHMKHPEVYRQLGIKSPRGALLHGPPGTGKTLLAHAIAGKLQLPFISVSGTELVGGLSGESEERIRALFERVVSVAPSILFIDEIDAICGNRLNAQKDMEKRMVAQLLASFDGLTENNVLVLGATNNPDSVDPALRRAGRLEQEITLGIPSIKTRQEIIQILCKTLALDEDVNFTELAQITPGFVGADLQTLVNKASTFAVKRAFKEIQNEHRMQKIQKEEKEKGNEVAIPNGNKEALSVVETPVQTEASTHEDNPPTEGTVVEKSEETQIEVVTSAQPEIFKQTNQTDMQDLDILSLLDSNTPYEAQQLKGLTVKQDDFLSALKTTKPGAIREGIVTVPDVTWNDVGSLKEVRKDLQLAVLAPVKYPELLEKLGLTIPSGVLLCGPPGCGKTLLAKAVANEAGVNFISVKGPELLNMYVGESERAVRTCFRRARNSAPCVIFFDEFDALCPRRAQGDNNGAARVVNQLLTEMDGIESREGVFILAASNRPDIIDPAILRPGRLDKIMYVGMPGREDRVDILQKLTKGGTQPLLAEDVDFNVIADVTQGYSGADLAGLVRTAATNALTEHITNNTMKDDIFVTFKHFGNALHKCKPSVSAKEQLHYEKLRAKYASGSDDKDMELDTEAPNEESMDTV